jgi:Fic family protein
MHPFLDGNGRTARAVEALMLQRVGLHDTLFIAMSNYYYEEKPAYLQALNEAREGGHDLTPFLAFALRGIRAQCQRLFGEIRLQVAKALYRNTVADLFGRLKSPRKRVMSERQVKLLNVLLEDGSQTLSQLYERGERFYEVKNKTKAFVRDLDYLIELDAIAHRKLDERPICVVDINFDWPAKITETEFFKRMKKMPKSKLHGFLSS